MKRVEFVIDKRFAQAPIVANLLRVDEPAPVAQDHISALGMPDLDRAPMARMRQMPQAVLFAFKGRFGCREASCRSSHVD